MKSKKTEINPIRKGCTHEYKYMLSLRCGAKTRKQTSCLAPAVHGKKRCRMHGGAKGSGAPLGSQNALKHGHTTRAAKDKQREARALIRQCNEFMDSIRDTETNSDSL